MSDNKKELFKEIKTKEDFVAWVNEINWTMDKDSDINSKEKQEKIVNCIGAFFSSYKTKEKIEYKELLDFIYEKTDMESRYILLSIFYWVNVKKGFTIFTKYVSDKYMELLGEFIDDSLFNSIEFKSKEDSTIVERLIKQIDSALQRIDEKITNQNSALVCFTFIASFGTNHTYKNEFTLLLERKIIEYFVAQYGDKKDIKIMNYFPTNVLGNRVQNTSFIPTLYGYSYLFKGLDEKVTLLEVKNNNLLLQKENLQEQVSLQKKEINNLESTICEKDIIISDNNNMIMKLNNNINVLEARLDNEKGNMESGYEEMKKSLLTTVKKELSFEIEGIEDIIEFIPEDKKNRIQKRIDRINKILIEKLGE